MNLSLRYMRQDDIVQVVTIDRQAFQTPWSARSYAYEIGESSHSHMVVLEAPQPQPLNGWKKFIRNFNGHERPPHTIIGYGGLWSIVDEAHISTIATHTDWRGQGYGEVLLAGMIHRAITLEAAYIVLEVRVSNTAAQNLYKKYEFTIADTKKRYYRDDGEDAYDMRLDLQNPAMLERFAGRLAVVQQKHHFADLYSNTPRP